MHETLTTILADAHKTRLSITASRLLRLHYADYAPEEKILLLRWLVLCDKHAEALQLGQHIEQETLSPEQQGKVMAARLRLFLRGADCPKPPLDTVEHLPRWAKAFAAAGQEISYPTTVHSVGVYSLSPTTVALELHSKCLACGESIISTDRSQLFPPAGKNTQDSWLCPHCLSQQEWDARTIRNTLWDFYTRYFTSIIANAETALSDVQAVEALLLAKVIAPYAPIKFCQIRYERVGHLCLPAIRTLDQLSGTEDLSLDFYGAPCATYVSNATLARLWNRFFPTTVAATQLYHLACDTGMQALLTDSVQWPTHKETFKGRYTYPLHMNNTEIHQGLRSLEDMGIPRGSKICCLFVRDSAYLNTMHPSGTDSGHDYRNADSASYERACRELVARGWYVLRMGAAVSGPLSWAGEGIIDYATHFRTDFMDIWLLLHCDLCLAVGSGPDTLIMARHAPLLITNAVDLHYTCLLHENTCLLPKKMFYTQTKKILPLQQYLQHEAAFERAKENILSGEISYINNTENEIYDALCEQLDYMEGKLTLSQEDEALQKYYQGLTKDLYLECGTTEARFSIKYLREQHALRDKEIYICDF